MAIAELETARPDTVAHATTPTRTRSSLYQVVREWVHRICKPPNTLRRGIYMTSCWWKLNLLYWKRCYAIPDKTRAKPPDFGHQSRHVAKENASLWDAGQYRKNRILTPIRDLKIQIPD